MKGGVYCLSCLLECVLAVRLGPHVHEVAAKALGGLDGGHLARDDHHLQQGGR